MDLGPGYSWWWSRGCGRGRESAAERKEGQESLILIPRFKLAFIHIPKTGGTSITRAFAPFLTDDPRRYPTEETKWIRGWQSTFHSDWVHETFRVSKKHGLTKKGFKSFCVVRNPWDRAVSCYQTLGPLRKKKPWSQLISFEEFLKKIRSGSGGVASARPQVNWASGVDRILRFERLKEDFRALCLQFCGEELELMHFLKRENKPKLSEFYTDETRQMVSEIFAQDIRKFGYTFPEDE
jgi:hypothetical protein